LGRHAIRAAQHGLAEWLGVLAPAEWRLDSVVGVDRLRVADVTCGVGVDSRSPTLAVLGNLRCDARLASAVNEAMLVVVLVGTNGQSTFTRSAIQHLEGGIDLGGATRMRGLGVDDQACRLSVNT